jgi:L-lactate utilization protein LutC
VIIVVVILVPVIIYFAKDCEIKNLKEAQQKEIDAVKLQATELVQKTNEANLQNMAKVFSWAIRAAAMQNDTDQMNQLMLELVKIYEYQKVVLLAESGTVVLSTDKKFEGDGLTESFYKEVIGANEVKIYPQKNGDLFVSAPVFGIDSRLGTLVIAYRPTPLEFPEVKAEPEK